ncbi:ABC transporter permease [Roseiterribacter gracilis]|uniref:Spermidine/putrescine ABC transporter permease n=1 Tax=Roseiterribacter gracilis TaxID=2812848 RepID=A0A8S8XA37_9PROT|nr:spermidine/putrescine ABC transporter permease [Rhodospirillales bacterium TMPK1]
MNENWRKHRGAFASLLGPGLAMLAFAIVVPMALMLALSFSEQRGLTQVAFTGTLASYARALEPLYLGVVAQSVWISLATTIATLAIAYPVALAIALAPPKRRDLLLLLVVLPFWTNLLVRTYALIIVLSPTGLLYTPVAVVLSLVYVSLPFAVLPLYAQLERLDRRLLEASRDLGASAWTTFRRVMLPLTAPGLAAAAVLVFVPTLGSFLQSDLLGGAGTQMIGNVIERQFKSANDWPFGSALSFLLVYATAGVVALASLARAKRR